jgi:hypothetical protein
MKIFEFLNSSLFQTAVIFITGLTAFIIYHMNKYNEKKEAARIIINEIRIAEKAIQEIKNKKQVFELSVILPNNTWQHKKHLFINILDDDELNLINEFYYRCSFADLYRKMIFDVRNEAIFAKSNYMQEKLIDIMHETINNPGKSYESEKQILIGMTNNEGWIFAPETPTASVIEYIENIVLITPTNAGTRLKKIAK